jgi:hypothetical protein
MPKQTRNNKKGAGYLMPAEYFNPSALQPSSNSPALTTAPSPGFVRPVLPATHVMSPNTMPKHTGGNRKNKRKTQRGGFAASIMGSFVANAQAFATPLALLGLYTAFGIKRDLTKTFKNTQSNKNKK